MKRLWWYGGNRVGPYGSRDCKYCFSVFIIVECQNVNKTSICACMLEPTLAVMEISQEDCRTHTSSQWSHRALKMLGPPVLVDSRRGGYGSSWVAAWFWRSGRLCLSWLSMDLISMAPLSVNSTDILGTGKALPWSNFYVEDMRFTETG
jgi:hypothetical protein